MTETEIRLLKNLEFNFGRFVMTAVKDPDVTDIMLNPDGRLWTQAGGEMTHVGEIDRARAMQIVSLVGSSMDVTVREESPIVRGVVPVYGHRFEGMIPPAVDAPAFAIRKKAVRVFPLEEYVSQGIMPEAVYRAIDEAIVGYKNMLVIGGTGSGKTTLVNAIIERMARLCNQDRLAIIEDAAELQSQSPNVIFLRSSLHITARHLVEACMRLNPTRILFGEVINGAALDLLKSWNTGHPGGLSTIHANSAEGGLFRLQSLISEVSVTPMHELIGEAVDLCIFITARGKSRRITQVAKVDRYDSVLKRYELEYVHNEAQGG
ncbi:MAG: P-type conjugative transfer ATPase TrbB [Desulfovibrio sp.]|jgi:type IV secretion system protein VirB11|nr:P-type conjugative transfer ATPase TrbB [Desulfovibrio sp.]